MSESVTGKTGILIPIGYIYPIGISIPTRVHPTEFSCLSKKFNTGNLQKKFYKSRLIFIITADSSKGNQMDTILYTFKPHICLILGLILCLFFKDNPLALVSGALLITASLMIFSLRWWHRHPPVVKKRPASCGLPVKNLIRK
jgi:hypothetical protein